MNRTVALMVVVCSLCLGLSVSASEIKTSCPPFKPWDSKVAFHTGLPEPQGIPEHLEEDRVTRKDGLAYLDFDFEFENHDRAYLMCEYKDRTRIEYPIPGLLLRCGMTIRNYDTTKKPIEWLDVWCVSDDERKAQPKAKK